MLLDNPEKNAADKAFDFYSCLRILLSKRRDEAAAAAGRGGATSPRKRLRLRGPGPEAGKAGPARLERARRRGARTAGT